MVNGGQSPVTIYQSPASDGSAKQADFVEQCGFQVLHALRVFQFLLILVNHIEHVDDLIDMCCDACQMHLQAVVEQRPCQRVQQSLAVACKHVDDAETFGSVVVDGHLRFGPDGQRVVLVEAE